MREGDEGGETGRLLCQIVDLFERENQRELVASCTEQIAVVADAASRCQMHRVIERDYPGIEQTGQIRRVGFPRVAYEVIAETFAAIHHLAGCLDPECLMVLCGQSRLEDIQSPNSHVACVGFRPGLVHQVDFVVDVEIEPLRIDFVRHRAIQLQATMFPRIPEMLQDSFCIQRASFPVRRVREKRNPAFALALFGG